MMNDFVEKYTGGLVLHIDSVREYGRKLGLPEKQLQEHDLSKWSDEEFMPYAVNFHGPGGDVPGFTKAWLHHIHYNPHHWNHWIFPKDYSPIGSGLESGVAEMPEHFALEMIADWHGAGFAYQGHWDISGWFSKSKSGIWLHSKTQRFVEDSLWNLGYEDVVRVGLWAHEVAAR